MSMTKRAQGHRAGAGSGFTIVEIVIILIILGILGGVGVQYYMDLDDSSKAAICKSNRATLFRFLNMQKMLRKDFAPNLKEVDESDYTCPSGSAAYEVSTDKDGYAVVTCPNGHGTTQAGNASGPLGDLDLWTKFDQVLSAMESAGNTVSNHVDSTALNANYLDTVLEAFASAGIDLAANGIESWSYSLTDGKKFLSWSSVNISAAKVGDKVLTMRYNGKLGTYTVGYTTVTERTANGKTYNILDTSGSASTWEEAGKGSPTPQTDKSSFASAYRYYTEFIGQGNPLSK